MELENSNQKNRIYRALSGRLQKYVSQFNDWNPIAARRRHEFQDQASKYFDSREERSSLIKKIQDTISTGMDVGQYYFLHKFVKDNKPKIIFELGGGASTSVIAQALAELAEETGKEYKLFSFEDIPIYHEHAKKLLPEKLQKYVSFELRDKVEETFLGKTWGFRYASLVSAIPDLVIVDGPFEARTPDGVRGVCLDVFHVVSNLADKKLDVLIEGKKKTRDALKNYLKTKKFEVSSGCDFVMIKDIRMQDWTN